MTTDKTERKTLIDALNDANTIVLIQDGGVDSQIAERWLRANAPKVIDDGRMLEVLELPHLQATQSVCAVFRRPDTPAWNYVVNQQGSMISTPRPDAETFNEIVVTKPVEVAKYWKRDNPRQPGKIDLPSFLEALNASLMPLRLGYADHGRAEPREMKLRTM